MDVLVRWRQLNSVGVHSDWNDFSFVGTAIHDFVLDQGLSLSEIFSSCSKSLLSDQTDFHAFYFYFDQMKRNLTNYYIFQVIKLSFPFKVNMKAVFNTDFHSHRSNRSFLDGVIRQKDCKIEFFC